MNEISGSFEFGGLLCLPRQAEPGSYYFVPLRADLDRGSDGRPMFSLVGTGSTGFLMLTAVWRATDMAIDALRQEIAARTNVENPEKIKLSLAPVDVARCDLLLGDGAGSFQTLATSTTSQMPPYAALFSVSLTKEQFPQVAAAVNGRAGFLAVEYDAVLPTENRASARLMPQSARFVQWLRDAGGGDQNSFRSALEEAIQDRLAIVTVNLPENPSTQLIATLYERLISQAVAVLPRLIGTGEGNGIEELEVAVELVEDARQPLRPRVDLASLDLDPARITVAAAPSTERAGATPRPLRVSLGFDPAGAPLAWVRVRGGSSEVVLRAPDFRRSELAGDWQAHPLMVTAGFNNGAHNQSQDIRPPEGTELRLSPEHLGLRSLSVDATPLAAAGMDEAEISLRYRPPHRQDEQRATIQFHDRTWASRWWVVTRTASWLRYLEFSWKAIDPDGRVAIASTDTPRYPEIVLSLQGGNSNAAD
jgi:hypothetical protein